MDQFEYRDGQLFCENVSVQELTEKYGSPLYIYSRQTLEDRWRHMARVFEPLEPLICYSVKSSSNLHLLHTLSNLGSGMDVVSGGELYRCTAAGVQSKKIVFAGIGKTEDEIRMAIRHGVYSLNVESEAEILRAIEIAKELDVRPTLALRINPGVYDANTHIKTATGEKELNSAFRLIASKASADATLATQTFVWLVSISTWVPHCILLIRISPR